MAFADNYQRVVYETNPLVEVICQLRFPKLLKIDVEPPAQFQARVMEDYPSLEELNAVQIAVGMDPSTGPIQRTKSYRFSSDDGEWNVVLSSDFLALTSIKYSRWEDFRGRLQKVTTALLDQYQLSHFSRVGLRYKDVILRSKVGEPPASWRELIRSEVLGLAGAEDLHGGVHSTYMSTMSAVVDGVNTIINAGFVEINETKEEGFLIDTDFSIDQKTNADANHAIERADSLHRLTGPVFRWCITEQLHSRLSPQVV
ncbi:TIGR04255 family protein (plasmid) [Rhizobium sp. CB3060]|uniref:TIGR04255 family protein n=1 Tax=Rhizobium sp. CB3060 TaxID=3138255 RepID=UPI0021A272C7|nr:TIGR04255 family protein [Rhizobium tropici]UWU25435.1 TIGR04255 family protein [Rhizobium tropici]